MAESFRFNPSTGTFQVKGRSVALPENPSKLLRQLMLHARQHVRDVDVANALGFKLRELEHAFIDLQAELIVVGASSWVVRNRAMHTYGFVPPEESGQTIESVVASLGDISPEEKVSELLRRQYPVAEVARVLGLKHDVVVRISNRDAQVRDADRRRARFQGKHLRFHL